MSDHNTDPNRGQVNRTTENAPSASNGNPIIWVVIALLVVAALAWYFMAGGNDTTTVTEGDAVTVTTESPDATGGTITTEDPAITVEPSTPVAPEAPTPEAPAN